MRRDDSFWGIDLDSLMAELGEELKSVLDDRITLEKAIQTRDEIDRRIYLVDFTTQQAINFHSQVGFYNKLDEGLPVEKRKPIIVFVNSPGGDLYACYSMIDVIKNSKTPIHAYVMGMAASCGFLFTISCHKKIGSPLSSYLFHKGSAGMSGTADQVITSTNHYSKQLKQMKQIVLSNTKINESKWKKIEKEDYWMEATEALELGVIDEIDGEPIEIFKKNRRGDLKNGK